MATVKLILDKRFNNPSLIDSEKGTDNNSYPLKLRIFHSTIFRDISLGYTFKANEWKEGKVTKSYPNSNRANASIQKKLSIAASLMEEYKYQISKMDIDQVRELVQQEIEKQLLTENSLPEIVEAAAKRNHTEMVYLNEFGQKMIERKRKKGKHGTAGWYEQGINAILKFNNKQDIFISDLDATFLEEFEADCIHRNISKNGVGSYLRAVRTIVNSFVKEVLKGRKFEGYPWGVTYSIPHEKTKKRAVSKDIFNAVREYSFKEGSALWNAKNYMLFMFNMRGMNFIDIAKLKVSNITPDGRIEYSRSKTGRPYSIGITTEAKAILEYYISGKQLNDNIFPIGYEETEKGLKTYRQKLKRYNRYFREVVKEATGQDIKFSSYVIRHSWASIGKRQGVDIAVIGESLGHNDLKTTQVYLSDFDEEVLDKANELIVN